jgi:AraC family transcriptional regulator of adaptative response / DNA-3-methyladenine glycosylase II
VARALRLIAQGALDHDDVETLAGRLGVGGRHLRRLFLRQLGAPPRAVARSRRVHFARRLIEETDLPMGRIAHSSGFRSVRQFNQAIRDTFRLAPTEMRRGADRDRGRKGAGVLRLRLPFRPPFDWERLIGFLRPRAIPGIEVVGSNVYRRTVAINGRGAAIEIRALAGETCLELQVPTALDSDLVNIVDRARHLFDLDADPAAIAAPLRKDPLLSRLIDAEPGLRVPGCWDRFELGVRAIIGQQVTVRGATTLIGRLVETFGKPLAEPPAEGLTHRFPEPATLARANLGRIGMPVARSRAIGNFARHYSRDKTCLETSRGLEDTVDSLTSLPGIGEWTAHYIAMRAAGEPDAFPASDLGLRRTLGDRAGPATPAAVRRRAEQWRPWRAYAALYLWAKDSIETGKRRKSDEARTGRKNVADGVDLSGVR